MSQPKSQSKSWTAFLHHWSYVGCKAADVDVTFNESGILKDGKVEMRKRAQNCWMSRWIYPLILLCLLGAAPVSGQVLGGAGLPPAQSTESPNPLSDTTLEPGKALLFDLEAKFAKATADGGGPAFAAWFAADGVSLANGQAPVHGHDAIARQATWSPKSYQLALDSHRWRHEPFGRHGLHLGAL